MVRIALGSGRAPFRIDPQSDSPSGFEPALATAVVSALAPNAVVEFVGMPRVTVQGAALIVGDIDMALSLIVHRTTRTELFSSPYLISGVAVLVATDSAISSTTDLEGKTVVARDGSAEATLVEDGLLVSGINVTVMTMAQSPISPEPSKPARLTQHRCRGPTP